MGDQGSADGADGRDCLFARYTDRVIIDHCSFSWSIDETASAYFNTNFTMQWCMASESLRYSLHSKDAHGYGGIWGGQGATFHHNLFAHHTSRNPRLNGSRNMPATENGINFQLEEVDLRNNVIYNWTNNSAYAGEPRDDGIPSRYNFVGNYYKAGPGTPSSINDRIFQPTRVSGIFSQFYLEGNVTTANPNTTEDNWNGIDGPDASEKQEMQLSSDNPAEPLTEQTAEEAYQYVLQYVGACFPARDSHDTRILHEVETGTTTYGNNGIIDSQSEVGGWPVLESLPAPEDSDHDGMPDSWELANGLNPNNAADRNGDPDGDGYTHLEDYLNGLVNHLYPQPVFEIGAAAGNATVYWENQLNDRILKESPDLAAWVGVSPEARGSYGVVEKPLAESVPAFYRLEKMPRDPLISLVAPGSNASFVEGVNVDLAAEVVDHDNQLAYVEFLVDEVSLGTLATAPFTVSWTALGDGRHEVSAVAASLGGGTVTTALRTIWVIGSTSDIGITYPAELGILSEPGLFEQSNGGFRGSGYVNFLPGTISYVQFQNVDGGAGGTAQIILRYAHGGSTAREGSIYVNGAAYPLVFEPTGSWTTWEEKVLEIDLAAGQSNTILVTSLNQDLANLDEMIVVPAE